MTSQRLHRDGFSILELVVVVGIIGLFLTFAAPAWDRYRQSARFNSSFREVAAYVRQSRLKAIQMQRIYRFSFQTVDNAEAHGSSPDDDGDGFPDSREIRLFECTDPFGFTCSQVDEIRLDSSVYLFADETHKTFPDDDSDGFFDINFMPNGSVNTDDGDEDTEPNLYLRTDADIFRNQVLMRFGTAGSMTTEKQKW